MRDAGYRLRGTGCGVRVAGYGLRDAGCTLRGTGAGRSAQGIERSGAHRVKNERGWYIRAEFKIDRIH